MADKALMVVGQKRFVQTMRKAGADMDDLKEVNRAAAQIALPAVRNLAPRGKTGRLAGSLRVGATKRAGVIRAGRKAVPYAGPVNYGWPARHIKPRLFVNNGVASTESQGLHRQDTEASERKIMATTRITYTDGTSETVPITMRATCKAEAHAIDVGWGPITQSPVRSGAYAAYAALRMAGRNLPDFEHWLDTVASFDLAAAKEEPEEGNPTD